MDSDALVNEFLIESFENLSSINEDLTQLEKDGANSSLLNKVYRTIHTMKGSASFLGYKKLQDLTHSAENLLDELREDKFKINPTIIDTLLQSFDLCSVILKSIEESRDEGNVDISQNKKNLDLLLEGKGVYPASINEPESEVPVQDSSQENDLDSDLTDLIASHRENNTETTEPTPEPQVAEEGISSAALDSLKELIADGKMDESLISSLEAEMSNGSTVDESKNEASPSASDVESSPAVETTPVVETTPIVKESKPVATAEPVIAKESKEEKNPAPDVSERKSIADSFVRVNVKVLDKIMNIVGELVLNRNQIVQFSNTRTDNELSRLSQQLNIITSELQSEVMTTRMQPLSSILTKFERLVRDFSRQSDKQIELKLHGQETELDKTLIEAIKDPLVHIIRNACDHGLEPVHERELNGKPATGSVTIKAYNESGQVTIEIIDNGRGLNKDRISAKAIEKGLVSQERLSNMSDAQIFGMIFEPGFSTAEKITNISGRGVGMDVVKTNIEKIGGSVSVNSELGVGTTFKLRIPLTLAIIPALIIKCANESFAIPQLNLVELVRLEAQEDKELIQQIQGSEFFKLRGKLTPVFRLNKELKLESVNEKTNKLMGVVETDYSVETNNERNDVLDSINIVILNTENQYFGIIVDEILDTEEVVVKSLSNSLKGLSLFGGATIMGDGKVALILDALGFYNTVSSTVSASTDKDSVDESLQSIGDIKGDIQENLLFKLGDDRVYAVPLSVVSRLEEFEFSKVEMTGKQPILRYLDSPMPLINVESTLRLDGESVLKTSKKGDEIKCIVVTISGKNFGIVVKDVLDISIDRVEIDDIAVDRDGILGTIFINDKIISLIDIYNVIEAQGLNVTAQLKNFSIENVNEKKILVVDDSPMYRKMEADTLSDLGYKVDVAVNGEDGFKLFKDNQYDLLVTDIEMPLVNGYEFAKKIRTELNDTNTPIVALSTRYSDSDREKGREAGFSYHLEKFKKNEVINLVNQILSGE